METRDTVPVSIWLKPHKTKLLYCMFCREDLKCAMEGVPGEILMGIDASVVLNDNYRALKFPVKIKCRGNSTKYGRCPAMYIIQGFIEE